MGLFHLKAHQAEGHYFQNAYLKTIMPTPTVGQYIGMLQVVICPLKIVCLLVMTIMVQAVFGMT